MPFSVDNSSVGSSHNCQLRTSTGSAKISFKRHFSACAMFKDFNCSAQAVVKSLRNSDVNAPKYEMWPAEITCKNQKEQGSVQFQHKTRASKACLRVGSVHWKFHTTKKTTEDHKEDHKDQHQHPHVPHCHSID